MTWRCPVCERPAQIEDGKIAESDALRAEVERLTKCLAKANANHEQFERDWYLATDRLADANTERDTLKRLLDEVSARDSLAHLEARDQISTLTRELAERKEEYEALYSEWRLKNNACNEAYAIEIPRLTRELAEMRRARDEACEIAERCIFVPDPITPVAQMLEQTLGMAVTDPTPVFGDKTRIAELRKIGGTP